MMIFSTRRSPVTPLVPRQRRGLSLIEVMVAVMILGITMTFVGHISTGIAQSNRKSDLIAKRTFAMQQQANVVGALPFSSLTSTVLPATKNFTLGDFRYTRRISLTTTGSTSTGQTATIIITIVPQTSIASDTLLKETLTMYRSSPLCGTALGTQAC
jgi:prepilin-type N-terminal cleavage/methylation domain-containing protein